MKFAQALNSNAIKRMRNKIGKLKREDMTQLRVKVRKARLAEAMLPIEPFPCTRLGIVAGVAGAAIAKGPWGFAVVIGVVSAGVGVAQEAGLC